MKPAHLLPALLCLALAGCPGDPESTDPGDDPTGTTAASLCEEAAPCETLRDCPPSGVDCVIGVCVDSACQWVNLATVETLPVDPESGLPLGKGCKR